MNMTDPQQRQTVPGSNRLTSAPAKSAHERNTGSSLRTSPAIALLRTFIFFLLAALGGLIYLVCQDNSYPKTTRSVMSAGMVAPDFSLPAQDGRLFHLSNYKGRTVFLAFVPRWTDARTVEEAKALAAYIPKFDSVGAKVLMISKDSAEQANKLHERLRLPFPLLMDTDSALAKQFTMPHGEYRTTFVVAPNGQVRFRIGDAIVETNNHGQQLIDISKCCVDEVMAARAHGLGKPIGEYSLPRLDAGNTMETLIGEHPASVTVVLFLSVKCPCSNGYNERVRAFQQRYAGKSVQIVGVYSNQDETAAEIVDHARKNGFTFPLFRDERSLCADHFGAGVTPEVFALDNSRVLRYAGRFDDSRDPKQVRHTDLSDAVEDLLAGRLPNHADTAAFGCGIVRQ